MKSKVLYAEDEESMAEIVTDSLRSCGYDVTTAVNGQTALKAFKEMKPDICILDVMMPLKDGYTLAEDIRKIESDIPIIFLSARSLTDDVVRGFKSGGNDYLKKPFNIDELLIRIESLLLRFGKNKTETDRIDAYEFAGCTLDVISQQLKTAGETFNLSYKEFAILEMLIRKKNEVLDRQEILMQLWGDDTIYNSNSLNVFMAHIRKMLKGQPNIEIMGIRNLGYKLIC